MKVLYTLSLLLLACSIYAQTACKCCDDTHREFDFWVGEWVVKDSIGTQLGVNKISKIEGNCAVLEQWTGAKGSTGTSLNYYDKTDKTWNQVWVDNGSNILKLKGGLQSGQMVLKSELIKGQQVDFYYNQISWTPNQDGSVTQLWEILDKEGNLLQTAFKGFYHKKE